MGYVVECHEITATVALSVGIRL